jgi:ABC-type transport system involved in multi-copper enzyme maturation permease subunit
MPIYDQSYAHWKGRLEGRGFRWLPIMQNGIALVFKKKLLLALIGATLIPFMVQLVKVILYHNWDAIMDQHDRGFAEALAVNGMFYHDFLVQYQVFSVIVMCLFMGAPLIARDMRVGAMEVYFSKPILIVDYLVGKFMIIAFFVACVTLFPALILFIVDVSLAEKEGYFVEALGYLPGILGVSAMIILISSLVMLAASSLSRSARTASVVWFGFHVALLIVSEMSSLIFSEVNLQLFDIRNSLAHLSAHLFGCPRLHDWPGAFSLVYLLLIASGSLFILFRRIRGVEVVKS